MRTVLLSAEVPDELTDKLLEKGCVLDWGGQHSYGVKVMKAVLEKPKSKLKKFFKVVEGCDYNVSSDINELVAAKGVSDVKVEITKSFWNGGMTIVVALITYMSEKEYRSGGLLGEVVG